METYQRQFIEFALQHGALKFGDFTLKSGRQSPYFFNLGVFHDGEALNKIGYFYATALQQTGVKFDVLFGPAYKGIPLVCATTSALVQHYKKNVDFCYNRKESKGHGEGGVLVGAPLHGQQVFIIDDVMAAGTAVREAISLIRHADATLVGVMVSLDRQEAGMTANLLAAEEIQRTHQVPVFSIIQLEQLLEFVSAQPSMNETLEKIRIYRAKYGVSL
ncbi:MAG: orotate phosphoribosyltransferase [Gammaproteobacteria bacterium]